MHYANYVAQVDESDCGVAALAMILKNFGSIYPLAKLRNIAHTTKRGTTALGLVQAANRLGLKVTAIKTDPTFLFSDQVTFPFIAHVVKDNLLHYYVVFKIDRNYVYIADPDPAVKAIKMPVQKFNEQWSGVCLLFSTTASYQVIKDKLPGLIDIFSQLASYKQLIFGIILAAIIITLISILSSYYLQFIIDSLIPRKEVSLLTIITAGFVIIYILSSLLNYFRDYFLAKLDQNLTAKISLKYIHHLYHLPIKFFATRRTGEITSRFNDINKIIDAVSSTVMSIFLDAGMMLIIGLFLFHSNQRLFEVTLLSLPLFILVIYCYNQKFAKLDKEQMEANAIVSSSIIEDIKGMETLKVLQLEDPRYSRIFRQFNKFLQKNVKYAKLQASQSAIKGWLNSSLTAIILLIGAAQVINNQISLGSLMAYNTLLAFFLTPLQNIINLQIKLQEAKVANNRLNEILAINPEDTVKKEHRPKTLLGDIKIQNLSYSYGDGNKILQEINLTIKNNSKLAIVGPSGSGKSTFAKVLEGFYPPTSGEIFFNNVRIEELAQREIRKYVLYIPQTPHLFSGSIRENLLLGSKRNVSQNELDNACQQAEIYADIQSMSLKYDTYLDEDASSLSGGQKQRITIARALLSPAHVLIFDESTSNLDPITEGKIVDNILNINDKTTIFIAHRLAIAKKVNQILVLKDGKIIENGSHQELLKARKYYYNLCQA